MIARQWWFSKKHDRLFSAVLLGAFLASWTVILNGGGATANLGTLIGDDTACTSFRAEHEVPIVTSDGDTLGYATIFSTHAGSRSELLVSIELLSALPVVNGNAHNCRTYFTKAFPRQCSMGVVTLNGSARLEPSDTLGRYVARVTVPPVLFPCSARRADPFFSVFFVAIELDLQANGFPVLAQTAGDWLGLAPPGVSCPFVTVTGACVPSACDGGSNVHVDSSSALPFGRTEASVSGVASVVLGGPGRLSANAAGIAGASVGSTAVLQGSSRSITTLITLIHDVSARALPKGVKAAVNLLEQMRPAVVVAAALLAAVAVVGWLVRRQWRHWQQQGQKQRRHRRQLQQQSLKPSRAVPPIQSRDDKPAASSSLRAVRPPGARPGVVPDGGGDLALTDCSADAVASADITCRLIPRLTTAKALRPRSDSGQNGASLLEPNLTRPPRWSQDSSALLSNSPSASVATAAAVARGPPAPLTMYSILPLSGGTGTRSCASFSAAGGAYPPTHAPPFAFSDRHSHNGAVYMNSFGLESRAASASACGSEGTGWRTAYTSSQGSWDGAPDRHDYGSVPMPVSSPPLHPRRSMSSTGGTFPQALIHPQLQALLLQSLPLTGSPPFSFLPEQQQLRPPVLPPNPFFRRSVGGSSFRGGQGPESSGWSGSSGGSTSTCAATSGCALTVGAAAWQTPRPRPVPLSTAVAPLGFHASGEDASGDGDSSSPDCASGPGSSDVSSCSRSPSSGLQARVTPALSTVAALSGAAAEAGTWVSADEPAAVGRRRVGGSQQAAQEQQPLQRLRSAALDDGMSLARQLPQLSRCAAPLLAGPAAAELDTAHGSPRSVRRSQSLRAVTDGTRLSASIIPMRLSASSGITTDIVFPRAPTMQPLRTSTGALSLGPAFTACAAASEPSVGSPSFRINLAAATDAVATPVLRGSRNWSCAGLEGGGDCVGAWEQAEMELQRRSLGGSVAGRGSGPEQRRSEATLSLCKLQPTTPQLPPPLVQQLLRQQQQPQIGTSPVPRRVSSTPGVQGHTVVGLALAADGAGAGARASAVVSSAGAQQKAAVESARVLSP